MLVSPGCSNALARPYIALLWLSVGNLFRSWVHRTELRTSAAVRLRRSPGIDQYGPRASATRNKGLTSFRLEGNEKESGGRIAGARENGARIVGKSLTRSCDFSIGEWGRSKARCPSPPDSQERTGEFPPGRDISGTS